MKKQAVVFVCIFLLIGLTACSVPAPATADGARPTDQRPNKTAAVLATSTAEPLLTVQYPQPRETGTPERFPTVERPAQPTLPPAQPTHTAEQNLQAGGRLQIPCNVAHPGRPFDVTVPDETRFAPGEYFSKTWRLVNAGACPWTRDYTVVWFSGEAMGASQVLPLQAAILPGMSADITVEMVAPQQPGVYQSNWKLRDERGELFGIGPTGDSPFWVRIVVVPVETDTPTPAPPAATDTPLVYSGGALSLVPTDGVDLDSVLLNQGEEDDLLLENSAEALLLRPVNSARVAYFGVFAPELDECRRMETWADSLNLEQIQPGAFLCYQTTAGLPGRAYLAAVDPQLGQVDLEFLTWAVP